MWTPLKGWFDLPKRLLLVHEAVLQLLQETILMRQDIQDLRDKVARNNNLVNSVVELVKGSAKLIQDNAEDAEAVRQIAADLDTQAQTLATAVPQNTPAAEPTQT